MKVMHVIAGLGAGGAETQLVNLATANREGAPEVQIVNLLPDSGGANAAQLATAGVETVHLGLTGFLTLGRTQRRLARLIRRHQPHVIQSWMYYADLLGLSALHASGRRPETRLYWGVRCSDMDLRRYGRGLRRAVRWGARRSPAPDGVVVNAEAGRAAHEALGYRPRAWHLVENGIDTDRFHCRQGDGADLRKALGLTTGRPVVLHVARVDPMKDHETLIAVAKQCPDIQFVAVGRGTRDLSGPCNLRGIGRHDEIGNLSGAAGMAALYGCADIIVSTSAFGEGFSNTLAEGMACGLYPVATDVGDARRILGETGRVVPPRDDAALAAALREALAWPLDRLREKGRAARDRIVDHFSVGPMVEKFDRLHRTGSLT